MTDEEEKILLYDLTNTFFEGPCKFYKKGKFGVSKEKRSACRLVTLALLTDANRFTKKSEFFERNVSVPGTLSRMLPSLSASTKKPIVVADAGIGTDENIQWLRNNGCHYIVVYRKRKMDISDGLEMTEVRSSKQRTISAAVHVNEFAETVVYCYSTAKEIKDRQIKNRFEMRFEDELKKVHASLFMKNGTKKYEKVIERIGRLKERYARVAHRYEISVKKDEAAGNAIRVEGVMKEQDGRPPDIT